MNEILTKWDWIHTNLAKIEVPQHVEEYKTIALWLSRQISNIMLELYTERTTQDWDIDYNSTNEIFNKEVSIYDKLIFIDNDVMSDSESCVACADCEKQEEGLDISIKVGCYALCKFSKEAGGICGSKYSLYRQFESALSKLIRARDY